MDALLTAYVALHVGGAVLFLVLGGFLSMVVLSTGRNDEEARHSRLRLADLATKADQAAEAFSLGEETGSFATRLRSLAEALRYSDPMSHPSLAAEEERLANLLETLRRRARILPTEVDPRKGSVALRGRAPLKKSATPVSLVSSETAVSGETGLNSSTARPPQRRSRKDSRSSAPALLTELPRGEIRHVFFEYASDFRFPGIFPGPSSSCP